MILPEFLCRSGFGDGDGALGWDWRTGLETGVGVMGGWGLVFQGGDAVSSNKCEFERLAVTNMNKSKPR